MAASSDVRTFLFADIRGYTRFTVDHGDDAAARLATKFAQLARDAVTTRNGHVIELRGDEALAVFSSPRQALRAAVTLQEHCVQESLADPSLPLRVGMGLDAGEAVPVEGGYRGAALNLAARLCSLAGPGEILLTDTVATLARKVDDLEYGDRGMVEIKGFADPVKVIQVIARIDLTPESAGTDLATHGSQTPQVEQRLPIGGYLGSLPADMAVAREEELSRLMAVIDAVAEGRGRLVLLGGEPGAGKTRLAQEVTLQARKRGFLIAAGRCYESDQSVPYYPFLDALVTVYGGAPHSVRAGAAHRWPYLSALLPEQLGVPPMAHGEALDEQQRLVRAVTGFLEAVATTVPIALMINDLHWADSATLKLLLHLARHTGSSHIMLLGTYRDREGVEAHDDRQGTPEDQGQSS